MNRLTRHIVRKLQGHVTNKKKKTATCPVDGSTVSRVEVSAISTTSQTSTSKCRLKVDSAVADVTNDGRLFHAWAAVPGKCNPRSRCDESLEQRPPVTSSDRVTLS